MKNYPVVFLIQRGKTSKENKKLKNMKLSWPCINVV